jgi:hypothetical protein
MSVFKSPDEMEGVFVALFDKLQQTPAATRGLQQSRLVVRLRCLNPALSVTVDARRNPVQVSYNQPIPRPHLDIELTALTLHQILLGQLSLTKALGQKKLKVEGPLMKAMLMADLFHQGRAIYPAILADYDVEGS